MAFARTILVISGTNRPGSNALRLARIVLGHYHNANAAAELFSLAELPPEIFHPSSYAARPDAFAPIQRRVLDAAGLHLIVPEYNGSFPGVLKYFIDMLKFPESFERRPVAFVGEANGVNGALRAVEQLQLVFAYRNAFVYPQRVFIPQVKTRFDADGRLTDPDIDQRLARQVTGFVEFVGRLSAKS